MTLKTIKTGSDGNCYILTSDQGKHLIIDAGIPIGEIKKGLDFDVANVEGCITSHEHLDHSLSAEKVKNFAPVWQPYLSEHKRLKTHMGSFEIECFGVPHNGTENRGFLIKVDGQTICYLTDLEYLPYSLSKREINILLVELNYQKDRIREMDEHRQHTVLGHCEEQTTIGIIKENMKHLRRVILCHMSMSGALDRDLAIKHIREVVPEYIEVDFATPGATYNLDEIPF